VLVRIGTANAQTEKKKLKDQMHKPHDPLEQQAGDVSISIHHCSTSVVNLATIQSSTHMARNHS